MFRSVESRHFDGRSQESLGDFYFPVHDDIASFPLEKRVFRNVDFQVEITRQACRLAPSIPLPARRSFFPLSIPAGIFTVTSSTFPPCENLTFFSPPRAAS